MGRDRARRKEGVLEDENNEMHNRIQRSGRDDDAGRGGKRRSKI